MYNYAGEKCDQQNDVTGKILLENVGSARLNIPGTKKGREKNHARSETDSRPLHYRSCEPAAKSCSWRLSRVMKRVNTGWNGIQRGKRQIVAQGGRMGKVTPCVSAARCAKGSR